MSEDIENLCRICLDVETEHLSLFEEPDILLHIKSCLGIVVTASDSLPKKVCTKCTSQLRSFYNFQLNARCSQDWLETCVEEKNDKQLESKQPVQPLPDSEYNSDSLLEFLNNTANIEEYLSNLGKEDIPTFVNMLEKNHENSLDLKLVQKKQSPKKKEIVVKKNMEIQVLESEIEIVKEILMKEIESKPKTSPIKLDKTHTCFGCKTKLDSIVKFSQHLSTCEMACRTCIHCQSLFNSRTKMLQHKITHIESYPTSCDCGTLVETREKLLQHYKVCFADQLTVAGYVYRCKKCGMAFKDRFQLWKHAKSHILKAAEMFCDVCGSRFVDQVALSEHKLKEHGQGDDLSYRCKICQYESKDRKEILSHVQKHVDTTPPQRHLCETCGLCFSTKTSLTRHTLQHTKSEDHLHCNFCQKTFENHTEKITHICCVENVICERCGVTINSHLLHAHFCDVEMST